MTEPRDDPELLNSATGAGLLYFFDVVIKRGDLTQANGSALRTACKKVLGTDDGWETLDLRNLNVDDLLKRFVNKSRVSLNDRSLRTYDQRFRQSVEMYLKFINREDDWNSTKPRSTGARSNGTKPSRSRSDAPVEVQDKMTSPGVVTAPSVSEPGRMLFPIPLRPGRRALLDLPEDMTEQEADKVAKVVAALATSGQLAITAGQPQD